MANFQNINTKKLYKLKVVDISSMLSNHLNEEADTVTGITKGPNHLTEDKLYLGQKSEGCGDTRGPQEGKREAVQVAPWEIN
ncbi:hypothetical protein Bhyg_08049 [Pseudolycoriella hygida]|uniref:Uncharacterized protein n=1 Tax=Pseudolycoriella hygida TaxID=35572 RepID=A0A9Q0S3Y7_9DIPT|nr:hypothetical protein Bhyg_08049 [Pseudolycoriella hygida]